MSAKRVLSPSEEDYEYIKTKASAIMKIEDTSTMLIELRDLKDLVQEFLRKDNSIASRTSVTALRHLLRSDCTKVDMDVYQRRIAWLTLYEDLTTTLTMLEYKLDQVAVFTQAELVTTDNSISNIDTTQNFTDVMGDAKQDTSLGKSLYSDQGQNGVNDMGRFLERPIKLYEVAMAMNTDINLNLSVWNDFINVPAIRAKVRNFAYLRGDLHIRISVSGLPFHYGKLLASGQPLNNGNYNINYHLLAVAADVNMRPLFLNYLSQAPGSVIIDVTENKPVDMVFPFISPKHMHRLFNDQSTAIGTGTNLDDFYYAGNLHIRSITKFGSVSASPTPVYMQVYAWMENVELGTNTGTQLAITTESEKIVVGKDERAMGPVETVSSALYKVASSLTDIPVIGVFAKASSIALGALSSVAHLFGWSKPLASHPVQQVKNQPFSNGAVTIGTDTNKKIAMDPKQELSVDPRICGSMTDDMAITAIAGRVSYLKSFVWADTDTPLTSPIFASRVHPNLVTTYKPSTVRYIQPTAMAFAVMPFAYWRGDIVFRFEVVCSAFHRGKLATIQEPNLSQRSLIDVTTALNKQYIKVIDIQETRTWEVRVKWAAYRAWLLNCTAAEAYKNLDDINGTSGVGYCNGYISVMPFTKLQSPDSSDVYVNVYVYSPDLQVNGYTDLNLPNGRKVIAQSARVTLSDKNCISSAEIPLLDLNESTATTDTICHESFGEQILSFRSALKRYVTYSQTAVTAGVMDNLTIVRPVTPVNQIPYTSSGAGSLELYSYLKYAYLGSKGGWRYRVHFGNSLGESINSQARFTLNAPESSATASSITKYTGYVSFNSINGTVTFIPQVMSAYEVEVPLYTNNLFLVSFSDLDTLGIGQDFMCNVWYKTWKLIIDGTGPTAATFMELSFASAEDFTFMRFQGAPMHSVG